MLHVRSGRRYSTRAWERGGGIVENPFHIFLRCSDSVMPRSRLPVLHVYLIHWNAPDWLGSAVRSLQGSREVAVRLSVVDNGGAGLDDAPLELPPDVRVISSGRNLGYAGGANLGLNDWLQHGNEGEFVLIGSHDLHVEARTLSTLLSRASDLPRLGVAAPVIRSPVGSMGGEWDGRWPRHLWFDSPPPLLECQWVSGTCMLISRTAVEAVGGFDPAYGSYVEDVDFCLRVRDAGLRVVVITSAIAWGLGSRSEQARVATLANLARLRAKRDGWSGAARSIGLACLALLRTGLASLAPLRSREERRASRVYASRHAKSFLPMVKKLLYWFNEKKNLRA